MFGMGKKQGLITESLIDTDIVYWRESECRLNFLQCRKNNQIYKENWGWDCLGVMSQN